MDIPVAAIQESGKENTLSLFFNVKDKEAVNSIVQDIVREKLKQPEHTECSFLQTSAQRKGSVSGIVAFMVAEKFGLDTSQYSFPYIASWLKGKQRKQATKELALVQHKNALQEIQSAAKQISNAIESGLLKMQKRHLSIDKKLADTELNNTQKAEFLIEDCSDRSVEFSYEDTNKIIEFAE